MKYPLFIIQPIPVGTNQVISYFFFLVEYLVSLSFMPFPMCFDLENHHSIHDNPSCHMFNHQKLYSSWISQSRKGSCRKLCNDWCESSEGNGRARGLDGLSERSSAGPQRRVWMADAPLGANASLSILSLSFWMPTGRLNIEKHCLFPEEPFRECETKFSNWVTSIIVTFYSVFWDWIDI